MNTDLNDKALFYLAKSYGYNGELDEKINVLRILLKDYPLSKYRMNGTYELARCFVSKADYDEAMELFISFVATYPKSINIIDARIGIADLYFKKWDYVQSELEYIKIINEFENDNDSEIQSESVSNIKPVKLARYIKSFIELLFIIPFLECNIFPASII
jgi:TolA-binding protein